MSKKLSIILLVVIILIGGVLVSVVIHRQQRKLPEGYVVWTKIFCGSLNNSGDCIQQTSDGGYVAAGDILSLGAGYDICVLKLDMEGNLVWDKKFGTTNDDRVGCIQQTLDGGYIMAGMSKETVVPGQTESARGKEYARVWRLDTKGNLLWSKKFGGSRHDRFRCIRQTSDGRYVVAGTTTSKGAGAGDVRIMKLDTRGNIVWDKVYGGKGNDWAFSLDLTSDGGCAITGYTSSKGAGGMDVWVLKLDANGNLQWDKTFGGTANDDAFCIKQTSDRGYIVVGWTKSKGSGDMDILVLKLDTCGNLLWEKTFGEEGSNDSASSVHQTPDGGYMVTGHKWSDDCDAWVLRLDTDGNLLWDKTFKNAEANCIQQTSDRGYVISGQLIGGNVEAGVLILKLAGK